MSLKTCRKCGNMGEKVRCFDPHCTCSLGWQARLTWILAVGRFQRSEFIEGDCRNSASFIILSCSARHVEGKERRFLLKGKLLHLAVERRKKGRQLRRKWIASFYLHLFSQKTCVGWESKSSEWVIALKIVFKGELFISIDLCDQSFLFKQKIGNGMRNIKIQESLKRLSDVILEIV